VTSTLPSTWLNPTAPSPLDPQIVEFMRLMAAEGGRYPKRHTIPIAEGRANAEKVRAPWTQGGPEMARTVEQMVPTRHGDVRIRVHYPGRVRCPARSCTSTAAASCCSASTRTTA
jgi:acetyl esterase